MSSIFRFFGVNLDPPSLKLFYYLAIDNDWTVDIGANEGIAEGIEITFKRGSRIADPLTPPNVRILPSILEGILDSPHPLKIILMTMTGQLTCR